MEAKCQKCGDWCEIREGCEHTGYCDPCAQTMLSDLIERGDELYRCLNKYQARYVESAAARKDHSRSAEAMKRWRELGDRPANPLPPEPSSQSPDTAYCG